MITSSNVNPLGQTDQLAKAGDEVTIRVVAREPLKTAHLRNAEGNLIPLAQADNEGKEWKHVRTVTEGLGFVAFDVVYTDLAGNVGDEQTDDETTNSSRVLVDTIAPTIESVSFSSSNGSSDADHSSSHLAMEGDTVTLSFTTDERVEDLSLIHI